MKWAYISVHGLAVVVDQQLIALLGVDLGGAFFEDFHLELVGEGIIEAEGGGEGGHEGEEEHVIVICVIRL